MTERENMQMVWDHKQPEWVPMINTASQMIITPEINDRPLFMSGKDDFGLEWELDPAHPELMTHVKPGGEIFDDITEWKKYIDFKSCKDKNWEAAAMRTKERPIMSKLNGTWNIVMHTFMGDMRSTLVATVEGDVLTGTVTDGSNGAVAPVVNGKVDGDKFSYELTIKTAVGEMTNNLTGELVGDVLKGTSSNAMGSFEFEATRA